MSFIDHYPIVTLPRVSDLPLKSRVVIPSNTSIELSGENGGSISVGISKSNISNYVVYPTPRLIWSYPISPSSIIECISVKGDQYMVGITERKQYKLLKLVKGEETSEEVKFKSPVKYVKFGDDVTVLLENGDVITLSESLEILNHNTQEKGFEVIYADLDQTYNENIIIILKNSKKQQLKYIIGDESYSTDYNNCLFETFGDCIYKYNIESQTIEKLNSKLESIKSVDLSTVLNTKDSISISVPSDDRLVISDNSKMYLMNLKYSSKLDEFLLDENSDNEIIRTIKVKNSPTSSMETKLFYLKLNHKKNKLGLNLLNVNVGLNNLLSNINKGIFKTNDNDDTVHELTNLIQDDYKTKKDSKFTKLMKLSDGKDLSKFETEAINYLKNRKCKLNYYNFDTEDKPIDINAIKILVSSILVPCKTKGEGKQEEGEKEVEPMKLKNKKELPKYLLNYLVSHKLFPVEYTKGLLQFVIETKNYKLIKSCILFTPNLPINELVDHLLVQTNLKVVNLILHRLTEFKFEDISAEFKNHAHKGADMDQLFGNLIELNTNQSFKILKHLVDLRGLNGLPEPLVDNLIEYINHKIELLELNSFNLNLLHSKFKTVETKLPSYCVEVLDI